MPAMLACVIFSVLGCQGDPIADDPPAPTQAEATSPSEAIDAFGAALSSADLSEGDRVLIHAQRFEAVKRGVALAGIAQDDAFYASRAYWHTGYLRGGRWTVDEPGDLDSPVTVDGRGTVLIVGDCNADITITDDSVVHILGNLNAKVTFQGQGELVIAGNVAAQGAVTSTGTLHLFTGGAMAGEVTCGSACVATIDGDFAGTLNAASPSTRLHITGDFAGTLNANEDRGGLLVLQVDGFMPTRLVLLTLNDHFTRATASIAQSDVPPGLYPSGQDSRARATARWVVHNQRSE